MSLRRSLTCLILSAAFLAGGCSTVTVRVPGGEAGIEHSYTSRAYVLGLYTNPFRPLFLPLDVAGAVVGGHAGRSMRVGSRLGKLATRTGKAISPHYAFSQVCVESTVGDWFMRIVTLGLYWPSTVTVWIVD